MKKLLIVTAIAVVGLSANAQIAKKTTTPIKKTNVTTKPIAKPIVKPAAPIFKTVLDSASYAFGYSMATQLKSGGLKSLNYDQLTKGLKDVFANAKPALTQEQCQAAITTLFESFSEQQEQQNKQQYAGAIKEGEDFLAQNKTKPNIKTTASGIQYEILTEGTGTQPTATDRVTVHYKGTLLNGTEFDSSYKRNEPTSFGLNQVIPGWTEGVQLMKEGAKYRFFIPYNLAYGARSAGEITPYSTLIFEIELIKVNGE